MDLFAELFPLTINISLYGYQLNLSKASDVNRIGYAIARHFQRIFNEPWIWAEPVLINAVERSTVELNITLDILKDEHRRLLGDVKRVEALSHWQADPAIVARFAVMTQFKPVEAELKHILSRYDAVIKQPSANINIQRNYTLRGWNMRGQASVSLSIASTLRYSQDLQHFVDAYGLSESALHNMRVEDRIRQDSVKISKITGTLAEKRAELLENRPKENLEHIIRTAPENGLVVQVQSGRREYEQPAVTFTPLLRTSDLRHMGIDPEQSQSVIRLSPAERSQIIKALADVAKDAGLIGNAYNSREETESFTLPPFEPYLKFGNNRSRPYVLKNLANDFVELGAYAVRDLYYGNPVEVCVINALDEKDLVEDYLTAAQRQLNRTFEFELEILRERRVRVVSLANIESAVRLLEKEAPDIILTFLPDNIQEETDEDIQGYVRSLTLGKGIPIHVILRSSIDDPDAMSGHMMSLLAKTGNSPFVLSDRLDFADYVIGVDFLRKDDELTAIARIYRSDGSFVGYRLRHVSQSEQQPPVVLLRDLFPQREFSQQRIVIHHDGKLRAEHKQAFELWGQAIKAQFMLVEILQRGAPRLYAFENKQIVAPPAGTGMLISDKEAFFISTVDKHYPTPQPLHISAQGLAIEQALLSVRLWTLLNYSTQSTALIPMTIYNTGELAYWLEKNGTLSENDGELPFWL